MGVFDHGALEATDNALEALVVIEDLDLEAFDVFGDRVEYVEVASKVIGYLCLPVTGTRDRAGKEDRLLEIYPGVIAEVVGGF